MHFLAVEELPRADFRVFLHLRFSFEQVFFNFLQLELLVILLGNESVQPLIKKKKRRIKFEISLLGINCTSKLVLVVIVAPYLLCHLWSSGHPDKVYSLTHYHQHLRRHLQSGLLKNVGSVNSKFLSYDNIF